MGSFGRWLAALCAGLTLLLALPALAAGERVCPGVTLVSPAGKVGFRLFGNTEFSWSREPRAATSRDLVLVDLSGTHNASRKAGPLKQKLSVHSGRYSWFVAFYDKAGRVICTSPVGSFFIPAPLTGSETSAQTSRQKAPKVTVTVHGRYIVVLVGSPYAGRRDRYVDADDFDGGRFKLPKGYSGLEIHGNDNDNILIGGARADRIFGYAGNDTIKGGKGNDFLHGGDESCQGTACAATGMGDTIEGGAGDDTIVGGNESCLGQFCVSGASLGDSIDGGAGNDVIHGGNETCTGQDCAIAGRLGDSIAGGDGDDGIDGGDESCDGANCATFATIGDTISGGAGADDIAGGNEGCSSDGCGDHSLQVGDSIDAADDEPDVVDGGGGDNVITADDNDVVTP